MTTESANRDYIQKTMVENWRREMEAAALYELSAQQETNERRKNIFAQLADVEYKHARMWEEKLRASGYDVTTLQKPHVSIKGLNPVGIVQRIEAIEDSNATWYRSLRNVINDEDILRILDEIDADEAAHGELDELLKQGHSPEKRLRSLWGRERHRQGSKDWVGDAIYGVNDGLGAIFGIISGVAGFTENTHTVLISGFFGALASTLSMGAGAWLATKSENEVMETTLAQERREIEEEPEHEIEELALLYQLKGFTPEESAKIAETIAQDKDQFLKTMVQEEFGFHEEGRGNPWKSALFGSLSTFVGGIIPLVPFFFLSGLPAMVAAAIVSLLAHFAVGAAKSLITVRSWWSSGLEMTLVGIIVGVVSYALGAIGSSIFGVTAV
ncbi:VIT1/CCC1 transporter family protein [Alicyclobacillus pomorum]|jgi:vacuolar iron transporter family protein|uniref:VIT1/CCC1 transporter family protein n=1 Tax=Alicyclobacillus pomorum TaxID=204470 RepID=UPI000423AE82|nr:VIT1/CCC1 transporter family protein [Alicyclobacillus pomorum]